MHGGTKFACKQSNHRAFLKLNLVKNEFVLSMTPNRTTRQPSSIGQLRTLSSWVAGGIVLTALLTLVGWQFDLDVFKRPIPKLVAMHPLTALCLLTVGSSLISYNQQRYRRLGQLTAFLPLTVSVLMILKRLTGWGPNLQTLLFAQKLRIDAVGNLSNLMAVNTAGCLGIVSMALLLLHSNRHSFFSLIQGLAISTGLVTLVTLLGYVYHVPAFYGALASYPMAIHTALCFLALSLGVLLTTADRGFIQPLFHRWQAGLPGQALVWAALLVPFFGGWLVLLGYQQGLFGTELAIALLVAGLTLSFLGFIWRTLRVLDQKDTQQRVTQQQLEAANADLLRSNESLQQFAFVASHDLQEPLRKIQTFGDLLFTQYGEGLGEGRAYLDRMQSAASRMSALITDLLDYSRIATTQQTTQTVSLPDVLNQVLSDLDLTISETGAQITIDPLPTIVGDGSQLGQLFGNLLSNALKFRNPNQASRIQVNVQQVEATELPPAVIPTRLAAHYHRINVIDNGIGFDERYRDRIFQVFQRLHRKSQYAGTGIGLAICQQVVANHGGAITASSRPGQGATFSIYLPH